MKKRCDHSRSMQEAVWLLFINPANARNAIIPSSNTLSPFYPLSIATMYTATPRHCHPISSCHLSPGYFQCTIVLDVPKEHWILCQNEENVLQPSVILHLWQRHKNFFVLWPNILWGFYCLGSRGQSCRLGKCLNEWKHSSIRTTLFFFFLRTTLFLFPIAESDH